MYFMSFPLQTELLPSILRRVPRQPGVSWYSPWVCGRGWRGGRGHDPSSSPVQPGQLGGSGLHVELGATSSIQSGRAYSAGEGGGCRLVEGGLVQKLKHTNFFFFHWEKRDERRSLRGESSCEMPPNVAGLLSYQIMRHRGMLTSPCVLSMYTLDLWTLNVCVDPMLTGLFTEVLCWCCSNGLVCGFLKQWRAAWSCMVVWQITKDSMNPVGSMDVWSNNPALLVQKWMTLTQF